MLYSRIRIEFQKLARKKQNSFKVEVTNTKYNYNILYKQYWEGTYSVYFDTEC